MKADRQTTSHPLPTRHRPPAPRHLLLLLLCLTAAPTFAQTAGWRGDGTGRFPAAEPPLAWDIDAATGILWKTEAGRGQSSPVVAGKHVFVTAEKDFLLCLDRASGKAIWSRDNSYESLPPDVDRPSKRPPCDPGCGYATPTPASDGRLVWAAFGTGVVACYDAAGERRWVRLFDRKQQTTYGRTTSPVWADGKLIVSVDGLVALDPASGKTLWDAPGARSSYGTPAVARIGDVPVLVTSGGDCVRLSDGRILAKDLAEIEFTSPVVEGRLVFFADNPVTAWVLPAEAGDNVRPKKLWETETAGSFYASPLLHEGLLYCVNNEGMLYVLETASGKIVFQKELTIPCASGKPGVEAANLWASPTLVGKHVLLSNDAGDTLVLAPGREYRETGHNWLDRGSGASPAADGKHLFLRGGTKVYCIGP